MAQAQDMEELELRLNRLEIQLLGVGVAEGSLDTTTNDGASSPATPKTSKTTFGGSPSPIKPRSLTSPAAGAIDPTEGEESAVLDTNPQSIANRDNDFTSRIIALEQATQKSPSHDALESHWKEINQYLQDLDPGTVLTHQQQIAAPLVYRRQEVLASADELKRDMSLVAEILNLLMIGQNMSSSSNTSQPITEMHVTKAPIVMTGPSLSREEQAQLQSLETTLNGLRDRVDSAAWQLDQLLTSYQKLVTAVSEKMVLLDEELRPKK